MIIYGVFIITVLISLFFYFNNPKEYTWWEFITTNAVVILLVFLSKILISHFSVMFTEYWGETITQIYEEEPYNYWKHETCTRTYACGTDKDGNTEYCTETYDCSHQEDVGPNWWCKTDLNKVYFMSEKKYDDYRKIFNTTKKAIVTRKNYSPKDRCVSSTGTKFQGQKVGKYSYIYQTDWPKTELSRKGVFTKHKYINKIKASDLSLFNIEPLSEAEADSLKLFKYPEIKNIFDYPTILGTNISEKIQNNFKKLNAKFGPTNQLRLWILVFENKPISRAIAQERYWVKGNKNELVICIGTKGNEITWSYSFSWATSNILTAEVKNKVLDLYEYEIITKQGQKLPAAIPLNMNNDLKEKISNISGLDTSILPSILPIKEMGINNISNIKEIKKSLTPILTESTWNEFYKYLDNNLNRFERRRFEEFSYLKVQPKTGHIITIYIIAIILSIILNIVFGNNNIKEKKY